MAGLVALGVTEGAEAKAEESTNGDPSTSSSQAPAQAKKAKAKTAKAEAGLVATLPGFQMLPDGGSRLFVALTHNANVTEKRDPRVLTYVIHGAHVVHRNNENALVTVHFNTPVTRARLLPAHGGLVFTVDLRADSPSVWRVIDAGDGSSMLQVDFPKGAFLAPGEWDPSTLGPGDRSDVNLTPSADNATRAPGAAPPPTAPAPAPTPAPAPAAPDPAPAPSPSPAPGPAQ